MSYQRWTQGDAYVIGSGDDARPIFHCVGCEFPHHKNYREIIAHLSIYHKNSQVALQELEKETRAVGLGATWVDYIRYETERRASNEVMLNLLSKTR
jgi:hypothetical protein